MILYSIFSRFISMGFIGYIPLAPGTFGTLAAVFFMVALKPSDCIAYSINCVFIIAGIVSSNKAEELFRQKDSHHIVIDEFAGYMASLLFLPF